MTSFFPSIHSNNSTTPSKPRQESPEAQVHVGSPPAARLQSTLHQLEPPVNYPPSAAICNNMPLLPHVPYSASDIPDYPQGTPAPIRIIHVGCGASGILFAHKVQKWLTNYQLLILEKNESIGGTWYENRYPGCACDIPAHSYVYPFEPNPEWSGYYSYSDEIHEYMMKCAKKWEVEKFVKIEREVVSAKWDDSRGKWEVEVRVCGGENKGQMEREECDLLVNGGGVVNKWKWPAIEGLHSFEGMLAHSAAWDQSLDWKDKRVAIIGTGSSSIQMVPRLAETAKSLKVFMRNPTCESRLRISQDV